MRDLFTAAKDLADTAYYGGYGVLRATDTYNTVRNNQFEYDLVSKKDDEKGDKKDAQQGSDPEAIADDPSKVETKPEQWVRKKGKLGQIADRLFSPSVSKLLLLISIPVMFFFASGALVIAAAAITGAMLLFNTVVEVRRYRELRSIKEERGLLEAIEYYKGINDKDTPEKGEVKGKDQDATSLIVDEKEPTKSKTKADDTQKPALGLAAAGDTSGLGVAALSSDKPKQSRISKVLAAGGAILRKVPESGVAIASAALSGNPVALGLTIGGAITGFGANASQQIGYEQMRMKLVNHNEAMAHRLGVEYTTPGSHRDALVGRLRHEVDGYRRRHPEAAASLPQQIDICRDPSFLSDAGRLFRDGFSWAKNCRNFTPMINEHGAMYRPSTPLSRVAQEPDRSPDIEQKMQLQHIKATHRHRLDQSRGPDVGMISA